MQEKLENIIPTFQIKTNETALILTSTDQLVVISSPWILCGFWLLFLVLSWSRINKYRCFILTLNKKVGLRKIICTYWQLPTHPMVSRKRNSEFSWFQFPIWLFWWKNNMISRKTNYEFSGTFNPIFFVLKKFDSSASPVTCLWHQKNETTNSPIHQFTKVLKGSLAFMQHFKFVDWWIGDFVFWCHEQITSSHKFDSTYW